MPGRQQIPRPVEARPGGPSPWADLPAHARRVGVERLRRAMAEHAGPSVTWPPPPPGMRPAAVLAAAFEEDGEARLIFTRRSPSLRRHKGEVSFPGGRLEPDEEPVSAALREAAEEVDLDPTKVEVVGELPPLSTLVSGSWIIPFVGVLSDRPRLRPNPAEVEHVFDVAVSDLLRDDVYREELWEVPWDPGELRSMYFFELEHDTIWGATARILHDLLSVVTGRREPPAPVQ